MTANVLTYIYPFLDPRRSRPGAHARPRTHLLRALRRQTESGLFFASDFEQIKRLFAGVYLVGFRRVFGVLTCSWRLLREKLFNKTPKFTFKPTDVRGVNDEVSFLFLKKYI